ncbi:MAG: hypothetical protein V7L26_17625 [Nostoc sp.]|uniref:hypothetical protein n=1 Tax=Nostoc sp. TaxID=1180 RepID=UPI002FF4A497
MQNLESLHEAVLKLKIYYQQLLENNEAAITKIQFENRLIEVQINHADALLLGYQVIPAEALQLVVQSEQPKASTKPATSKRINKSKKKKGGGPPIREKYQGMSVLGAATEVIKNRVGEVVSMQDIFAEIFSQHHSNRTQADLKNLLSRELSRGVKEGRFSRTNISGHYTCELSKIEKTPA